MKSQTEKRDARSYCDQIASKEIERVERYYKDSASTARKNLRQGAKILERILLISPEIRGYLTDSNAYRLDITEYSQVKLNNIRDKTIWAELLLNCEDEYGVPSKTKTWDDKVKFSWEVKVPQGAGTGNTNTFTIEMSASPEVNGCVLVEEEVLVPSVTIPERTVKQFTVKCV